MTEKEKETVNFDKEIKELNEDNERLSEKKSFVLILVVLVIFLLLIVLTVIILDNRKIRNISNPNGDIDKEYGSDDVSLIEKYWDGYVDYDKAKMESCFYPNTELNYHTEMADTGYFYTYGDIVVKENDDFFDERNYPGETMQHYRTEFKDTYGVEFDDFTPYVVTVDYEAGTNEITDRGTITFYVSVVTVKGKRYIVSEPRISR